VINFESVYRNHFTQQHRDFAESLRSLVAKALVEATHSVESMETHLRLTFHSQGIYAALSEMTRTDQDCRTGSDDIKALSRRIEMRLRAIPGCATIDCQSYPQGHGDVSARAADPDILCLSAPPLQEIANALATGEPRLWVDGRAGRAAHARESDVDQESSC